MWQLSRRIFLRCKTIRCNFLGSNDATSNLICKPYFARGKQSSYDETTEVSKLFRPGVVKESSCSRDAQELTGEMTKSQILPVLNKFAQHKQIRELCSENGLDGMDSSVTSMKMLTCSLLFFR